MSPATSISKPSPVCCRSRPRLCRHDRATGAIATLEPCRPDIREPRWCANSASKPVTAWR